MPTAKKTIIKKVVKKNPLKTPVKKAAIKKDVKALPKEAGLKLSVYSVSGRVLESMTLPKEIFGVDINTKLMTQAVRVYLANQRRGTVKTKSRGEVNISTRKIYRQKGTGKARHGAASAPIFVGGGVAFGPRPRDYSLKLGQKMKKAALFSSLSTKAKDGEIRIISGLEKIEPKTKIMLDVLKKLQLNQKRRQILLVTPKSGKDFENVKKGARNLEGVSVTAANLLNTYEILTNKNILFMKNAIETLKENFIKKN